MAVVHLLLFLLGVIEFVHCHPQGLKVFKRDTSEVLKGNKIEVTSVKCSLSNCWGTVSLNGKSMTVEFSYVKVTRVPQLTVWIKKNKEDGSKSTPQDYYRNFFTAGAYITRLEMGEPFGTVGLQSAYDYEPKAGEGTRFCVAIYFVAIESGAKLCMMYKDDKIVPLEKTTIFSGVVKKERIYEVLPNGDEKFLDLN